MFGDPEHITEVSKCVTKLIKRTTAAADTSSAAEKKESEDKKHKKQEAKYPGILVGIFNSGLAS